MLGVWSTLIFFLTYEPGIYSFLDSQFIFAPPFFASLWLFILYRLVLWVGCRWSMAFTNEMRETLCERWRFWRCWGQWKITRTLRERRAKARFFNLFSFNFVAVVFELKPYKKCGRELGAEIGSLWESSHTIGKKCTSEWPGQWHYNCSFLALSPTLSFVCYSFVFSLCVFHLFSPTNNGTMTTTTK